MVARKLIRREYHRALGTKAHVTNFYNINPFIMKNFARWARVLFMPKSRRESKSRPFFRVKANQLGPCRQSERKPLRRSRQHTATELVASKLH